MRPKAVASHIQSERRDWEGGKTVKLRGHVARPMIGLCWGNSSTALKLITWGILKTHWIDAIRSQVLSEVPFWAVHMDAVHRLNVSRGEYP